MAVRAPDVTALEIIRRGADRVVEVSDDEIAEAIRTIYSATHNCAEGAGAAALAALIKERERLQGRRAAVILSGQNIDRPWMQAVLAGDTPRVSRGRSGTSPTLSSETVPLSFLATASRPCSLAETRWHPDMLALRGPPK
jgi:threonine dehydratase